MVVSIVTSLHYAKDDTRNEDDIHLGLEVNLENLDSVHNAKGST